MSSDYAATMPLAIRRAEEARRPPPAEMLQDEAPAFPTTPIYARQRKRSGMGGVSPAALIGGGTVLVAAAVAVFALSWNSGPESVEVAAAPVAAPAAPLQSTPPAVNDPAEMAQAAAPDADAPVTNSAEAAPPAERVAAPAAERPSPARTQRAARVAPVAPSATDTAEDASAMLPDGPMPYVPDGQPTQPPTSGTAPTVTPPTVTPPPVIAPPAAEAPSAIAPAPTPEAAPAQPPADAMTGPTL